MTEQLTDHSLPPIPAPFSLPFFYGTFTNIGFDYLIDDSAGQNSVRELLSEDAAGRHLWPASFTGAMCVSFNYQLYFAQFGNGTGITQEIELNVVAYPEAATGTVPDLTYLQYVHGEDQTRALGFCRTHVACDSQVAIDAGVALFNEPKHKASFQHTLPVPNATTADPKAIGLWKVACGKYGTQDGSFTPANTYFSFAADLNNLNPQPVSAAPFTEYGSRRLEPSPSTRPLAAPLNVFSPYDWYDLSAAKLSHFTFTVGHADPQLGRSRPFLDLIKDRNPVGAWVYQSPPVAVQNRPYWVVTS
jgi:hypothetical protein